MTTAAAGWYGLAERKIKVTDVAKRAGFLRRFRVLNGRA
jgi:hypothetical protein